MKRRQWLKHPIQKIRSTSGLLENKKGSDHALRPDRLVELALWMPLILFSFLPIVLLQNFFYDLICLVQFFI